MEINLINLDRSRDRLADFTTYNKHLADVSRFSAVDGRTLDIAALVEAGVVTNDILSAYTRGALGNAMSHLALWDRTIASGRALTIAEDDAVFNIRFDACAESLLQNIGGAWDIVLWGWNFDAMMVCDVLPGVSDCVSFFDQEAMRKGIDNFQNQAITPQLFRLHRAFGVMCYSISPKGAQTLRNRCIPLRKGAILLPGRAEPVPNTGIDVIMNGFYPTINAYVSFPPIVVTRNDQARSTVQRDRSS